MGRTKKQSGSDLLTQSGELGSEAGSGTVTNKSQAARAAIDAGYDTPAEAIKYIRDNFGIEMTARHFSAVKSNDRRAAGKPRARRGRKRGTGRRGRPPGSTTRATATSVASQRVDNTALLKALETIKPLVDSFGKEGVKRMVDLIG